MPPAANGNGDAGPTLPAGMNFDAGTNTFTWTPTADQAGTTQSFTASVKDTTTGDTVTLGPVFVAVAAANGLTVVAPAASIASGSPVLVSFQDTNPGTPTYTISTSSTSDPTGSNLTATLLPQTNQVLKIVTDQGEMDFQLFNNFTPNTVQHFDDLVNSGTYNTDATFYRIIQSFVDQGGVGGSGYSDPGRIELESPLHVQRPAGNGQQRRRRQFVRVLHHQSGRHEQRLPRLPLHDFREADLRR